MRYDKGNEKLKELLVKYYEKFGHHAWSEVEWDFDMFEEDEFIYYIEKCLETNTIMTRYLNEHFGEWKHGKVL